MPAKPAAKPPAAQAPAAEPPKPDRVQPVPKSGRRMTPALHLVRDAAPYLLALAIFLVTANVTLNTTAARYADDLFALALVLMRTSSRPPTPPTP